MNKLVKISEVALKYDVTTRALRYYEDVGLIESTRHEAYAYRLYDARAIKRLEQILVLRKLKISVKDIKSIYACDSVEVLLDVLKDKAESIDDELVLLHELKEIVGKFIDQIKACDVDFHSDLNSLYERAHSLEDQLKTDERWTTEALIDVTDKLEKMPDVRVIMLPKIKMVRSGSSDLDAFDAWWSQVDVPTSMFPRDFMWYNALDQHFEWLYALPESMTDTNGYEVFDFPGGLYAVATAYDEGEEIGRVNGLVHKWVDQHPSYYVSSEENDKNCRYDMGHIITPPGIERPQMDVFIPIVLGQD